MALEKKIMIVSIAVLVMIVAMAVTEVDGRSNVAYFGRDLLESQTNVERRNLYDIVGAVAGKHCCNKVVTTCCAPAPAPKSAGKATPKTSPSKAATPKASSSKAAAPKASIFKSMPKLPAMPKVFSPKSSKAPTPKSSKSPKAPTPKSSKSPKAPTPKSSKSPKALTPKSSKTPTPKL